MTDSELVDRYVAIRWVRKQMVKDYYKQKFESLTSNKTPQERATWDLQVNEAKAFVLDNSAPTPTLTALSNVRGTDVESLANQVLTAYTNYNTTITELFAEEENYVTQLNNAEGDDVINVRLPIQTTIIPGDTRFDAS